MIKAWSTPIRIILVYLVGMAVWATFNWAAADMLLWAMLVRNFGLLFVSSWVVFSILTKVGWAKPTRWEHRLISCLILFLLFDSLTPWWVFVALGITTELGQRLIRLPTGPVANPAAFGALVIATMTGFLPTWWATNFGPRFFELLSTACVITAVVAGYVVFKYRKTTLAVTALVTVAVLSLVVLQISPLFLLLDGTLLFFVLVMAAEPKTSPVLLSQQVGYGLAVGVLTIAGMMLAWPEAFTAALVIANTGFNLYRNRTLLMAKFRPAAATPSAPLATKSAAPTPPIPPAKP